MDLVPACHRRAGAGLVPGTSGNVSVRDGDLVRLTAFAGVGTVPEHTRALNLAFDVTPGDLVTAIATERRVID